MDDRFVSFAVLGQGLSSLAICLDAPFTKPTQEVAATGRLGAGGSCAGTGCSGVWLAAIILACG